MPSSTTRRAPGTLPHHGTGYVCLASFSRTLRLLLALLVLLFLLPTAIHDIRSDNNAVALSPSASSHLFGPWCTSPPAALPRNEIQRWRGAAPFGLFPFPHVLGAAAAAAASPKKRDASKDATGLKMDYDGGLKPKMIPWRHLRPALRDAGCFSTQALPRLPTAAWMHRNDGATVGPHTCNTTDDSWRGGEVHLVNRTDTSESPTTLPQLCRKPVVLFSGRSRDCPSCNSFAEQMLGSFAAEWEYIRAHATLVDGGDPMTEQLIRNPYPLWYSPKELDRRLRLTPRFGKEKRDAQSEVNASHDSDELGALAREQADAEADYNLFNVGLRQKASLLMRKPAAQAGHQWSRLVQRTFAYPNEFILRIVFMYPHNGSVIRDAVNDGVLDGASPDFPHYFTHPEHFFRAVKKAVRVMDWLQRYGDY